MQKPASLSIPSPCHENWDAMTATQQGKFCAACSKQVIDFTLMSDRQILNVLAQQNGKLCGRFYNDQLEREIFETKVTKKKSLWLAFILPFMVLFQKSFGQKNDTLKTDTFRVITDTKMVLGKPLMSLSNKQTLQQKVTISGNILDEFNRPLWGASIIIKGTNHGVATDSLGTFQLTILSEEKPVIILVSCIGYGTKEKKIDFTTDLNKSTTLTMQPIKMGAMETVLTGAVFISHTSQKNKNDCKKITVAEKVDSTIKKITGLSTVSIYPNPVKSGNLIHINCKQSGNFKLQLLNSESVLLRTKQYIADQANTTASFSIPSNLSTGIYYIRIINTNNRKSYTEKLMVQ